MVRALRPVNASPDRKLPTVPEMEPLKRQRSLIYARLCQKGEKWPSQCRPRLFYSQPRQLPCARQLAVNDQGFSTASQGSCHAHGSSRWTHPPPPIPPFLLVQNLSSKQIAPTDNMRPKLHDEYTRHRVNVAKLACDQCSIFSTVQ